MGSTEVTTKFFDDLAARGHEPLLAKTTGTLRFDLVDGRRTSSWLVSVRKGDLTVSRQNTGADCLVSGEKSVVERVVTGEQNAMAAVLRGAVKVEGDPELLVLFQRLFPSPPRPRRRRAKATERSRS